jgi:hypothetical protein
MSAKSKSKKTGPIYRIVIINHMLRHELITDHLILTKDLLNTNYDKVK